jgi:hypothetical protein
LTVNANRSRPPKKAVGETVMDGYALVLNAGSSSLKFCVFQRPKGESWRLETRGQIQGIGTSPRLSARDFAGRRLADEKLDASVRDEGAAIDALAVWLRSKYTGSKVLAVGHRVVHGGVRFTGPNFRRKPAEQTGVVLVKKINDEPPRPRGLN